METVISGPVNLIWVNLNTDCYSESWKDNEPPLPGWATQGREKKNINLYKTLNPVQKKVVGFVCTLIHNASDFSSLLWFVGQCSLISFHGDSCNKWYATVNLKGNSTYLTHSNVFTVIEVFYCICEKLV